MTNLMWYISFAIIGVIVAAHTIHKKRDTYKVSTLVVFYLFSACVTWIGEFIVLGLFNAYAYKTGLFVDPWAQNLLGHLIINTTLYPAASIVMVGYSLRYGWISFVAILFTVIEYLFVKIGIYEQHWWKYYMTIFAVVFFLSFFHKWFAKMNQKHYGVTRAVTFYFVAMIMIHTPAPLLLLLGKQYYQISLVNNLAGNLYLSSIIIIFFYHLIEAFLLVLFTCILKKWYWKFVPFIISIVSQSILARMNIIIFKNGWNLIYMLLVYQMFIAAFVFIEKYTIRPRIHTR